MPNRVFEGVAPEPDLTTRLHGFQVYNLARWVGPACCKAIPSGLLTPLAGILAMENPIG